MEPLNMHYLKELLSSIKEKKELGSLDDALVLEKVIKVLQQQPKLKKELLLKDQKAETFKTLEKSKAFDLTVKQTRALLREVYGVFILQGYEKKEALLKLPTIEACKALLNVHQSSKERLPYYEEIYKQIFSITGKPKTILDLGCGLNPCSYPFLGCNPKYYASDFAKKDCDFLNQFFRAFNIQGNAMPADLTKENKFPKSDVCFLFKVADSLESAKQNSTRLLLKSLDCTWIVVSFPKVSLGQKKKIPDSKRKWFFTMLQYEGFSHSTFEVPNELFVVLKRTN